MVVTSTLSSTVFPSWDRRRPDLYAGAGTGAAEGLQSSTKGSATADPWKGKGIGHEEIKRGEGKRGALPLWNYSLVTPGKRERAYVTAGGQARMVFRKFYSHQGGCSKGVSGRATRPLPYAVYAVTRFPHSRKQPARRAYRVLATRVDSMLRFDVHQFT